MSFSYLLKWFYTHSIFITKLLDPQVCQPLAPASLRSFLRQSKSHPPPSSAMEPNLQSHECNNEIEVSHCSRQAESFDENRGSAANLNIGNVSLASTTSTPVCILTSCGIGLSHALLLWGQIVPQWSIYLCKIICLDII